MAYDDDEPPEGLFYEDGEDRDDPQLGEGDLEFSPEELAAIRKLSVVQPPPDDEDTGAEVIAFRNSHGEPVVVPTDVATEAERAFRAYKLNRDGLDWQEIAMREQYPSARAAKADVDRYLAEGRALVVEKSAKEMLNLEMARLNHYTFQLRDGIEKGSIVALTEARHLVMARARLALALGAGLTENNDGGRTVVISGETGQFIATLREAAGDEPGAPQPDEGT